MKNFMTIKGKNGSGKTAELLNQAISGCKKNKKVLIINNEESPIILKKKLRGMNEGEDVQGVWVLPHFEAATNSLSEIIDDFDVILIDNLELFLGCESLLGYEYVFEAMNMIQTLASLNENKEFVVTVGIKTMI